MQVWQREKKNEFNVGEHRVEIWSRKRVIESGKEHYPESNYGCIIYIDGKLVRSYDGKISGSNFPHDPGIKYIGWDLIKSSQKFWTESYVEKNLETIKDWPNHKNFTNDMYYLSNYNIPEFLAALESDDVKTITDALNIAEENTMSNSNGDIAFSKFNVKIIDKFLVVSLKDDYDRHNLAIWNIETSELLISNIAVELSPKGQECYVNCACEHKYDSFYSVMCAWVNYLQSLNSNFAMELSSEISAVIGNTPEENANFKNTAIQNLRTLQKGLENILQSAKDNNLDSDYINELTRLLSFVVSSRYFMPNEVVERTSEEYEKLYQDNETEYYSNGQQGLNPVAQMALLDKEHDAPESMVARLYDYINKMANNQKFTDTLDKIYYHSSASINSRRLLMYQIATEFFGSNTQAKDFVNHNFDFNTREVDIRNQKGPRKILKL